MVEEESILDLTPEKWAAMPLKFRLINYIRLVEYIYLVENKSAFKFEINDKKAVAEIVETIEQRKEGLIISGQVGCGKTFLMKLIQKVLLPGARFRFTNTVDVVSDFKLDGEESLSKYIGRDMLFDDLGFEEKGAHYANKVDCVDYLTYKRYEEFTIVAKDREPILTYFVTNLDFDQLKARYNERTIDRMRGMCKVVALSGDSFRQKRYSNIQLPDIFPINYGKTYNLPEFTMGPVKTGTLGADVKKRMDEIFGELDHENHRTIKIDKIINAKAK